MRCFRINYKLIKNSPNDVYNPVQTVFKNRGIDDVDEYMHLSEKCLYSPALLDNITEAAQCFLDHLDAGDEITILVDCDPDGYTSAALTWLYIQDYISADCACASASNCKVNRLLHSGKQHGITKDIEVPLSTDLLIIPDAGTNDVDECRALKEKIKGLDIIILDHHVKEVENPYAIIVNNQACAYPNKNLSGVGIVYKFLQVADGIAWTFFAEKNIDLVAIGNIADSMDIRENETRYLCFRGLAMIENPLIKAIVKQNDYSISNSIPTVMDASFYIIPLLNAIIRMGTMEQKDMLFRALVGSQETFPYKKRGTTDYVDEAICDKVVREGGSLKYRQKKAVDASLDAIQEYVGKFNMQSNKVMFCNVSGMLEHTLTGLVANKIAGIYKRPCLILHCSDNDPELFTGSARNIDDGPVDDLQQFLLSTGEFIAAPGHDNACGISIKKENIEPAIQKCNKLLADVDSQICTRVDLDIEYADLDVELIRQIHALGNQLGKGFAEPVLCIHDIPLKMGETIIMGKTSNSWKFTDSETGIAFVHFSCPKDDQVLSCLNDDVWSSAKSEIMVNCLCTVSMNLYKGAVTPQVKISEYECEVS